MPELSQLLTIPPFSLAREEKAALFEDMLPGLTRHHMAHCPTYARMMAGLNIDPTQPCAVEDTPFLPVRLFKEFDLRSVPDGEVQKTMTSSGTSGKSVSKIYLDRETATLQTKVLSKIVSDLIGPKRLPMLVIDAKETVKSRTSFSARGAGILGFSMFGRDVTYALKADMTLDMDAVEAFCEKHSGGPTFVFGFTSIIYQHLIEPLQASGQRLSLDQALLLHGGGWKKLEDIKVDNKSYKAMLDQIAGIARVHNYYGMVEQTGSIFTECSEGHLHASAFSDIIVRGSDLKPLGFRQPGLVQLVSLLPKSYPGHSILTEDMGEVLGEDDCGCDRLGKYFKIYGRAKAAEIRGCSDTYAA